MTVPGGSIARTAATYSARTSAAAAASSLVIAPAMTIRSLIPCKHHRRKSKADAKRAKAVSTRPHTCHTPTERRGSQKERKENLPARARRPRWRGPRGASGGSVESPSPAARGRRYPTTQADPCPRGRRLLAWVSGARRQPPSCRVRHGEPLRRLRLFGRRLLRQSKSTRHTHALELNIAENSVCLRCLRPRPAGSCAVLCCEVRCARGEAGLAVFS
jgi:hypothetical protein